MLFFRKVGHLCIPVTQLIVNKARGAQMKYFNYHKLRTGG